VAFHVIHFRLGISIYNPKPNLCAGNGPCADDSIYATTEPVPRPRETIAIALNTPKSALNLADRCRFVLTFRPWGLVIVTNLQGEQTAGKFRGFAGKTKGKKVKTMQLVIIACASLMLAPLANAQKYHAFIWNSGSGMTDLGTLGGDTSYAVGINDSGEVVGYSYLADNVTRHAFTWTASGGMVDLGTLPGGAWSEGQKINASGEISGEALDSNGKQVPVFWSASAGFVSLGENQGDSRNYGWSINDSGAITGQIYTGEVVNAIFWRLGGAVHFLPPLPGGLHMVGYDINNLNHITGNGTVSDGRWEAFIWSHARGTVGIGFVPGAPTTLAHAINDNDEVTGIGYYTSSTSAFYWSRQTGIVVMQTLGGAIGAGLDINLAGAIVGWSSNASGETHAALWSNYTSVPQDLGTLPGGSISYAYGINSSGQVVGFSTVP
jgi:probable HAF family extracellular repeat protein